MLRDVLNKMPVIGILRGIQTHEVDAIYEALKDTGVCAIEIPLNSPDPIRSIERLAKIASADCIVGAGTVTKVSEVEAVADAGGKLLVTPNTNPDVIRRAVELNMEPVPGFLSPTEAFAAVDAGAKMLKMFPGNAVPSGALKAVKSVLPKDIDVLAVGGIGAPNLAEWMDAGAFGIGVASDIYSRGDTAEQVHDKARWIVDAMHRFRAA